MEDPREVLAEDPYDVVTSDGEEAVGIEAQIAEIDRQKEDLLRRLKMKKCNPKPMDPNLNYERVESTPRKVEKGVVKPVPQQEQSGEEVRNENLSELTAQCQEKIPSNTTSFFLEKYSNSKREQEFQVRAHEELMKKRVHMFQGLEKEELKPTVTNELEEYSNLWINKRYIPKERQRSIFADIKILRLNKLFAKVRPPKFTEPQYSNWAVVGLISNKGKIKFTSAAIPKKYFKFTLTNFQYSIDTYVFGKEGVERYYNLCIGDIIAILNPQVLPWRPTGGSSQIKSFNLRISHKFDCILEIGSSRDLGWCPVLNKSRNGPCGSPINKDKQKCCEYHRETQFRNTNAKRVELSGTYALGAPIKADAQPGLYRGGSSRKNLDYNIITTNAANTRSDRQGDTLGVGAKEFSTRNAAKAFFNEKFHNSENLKNLESKRRKISYNRKSGILDRELKKASELDIKYKSSAEINELKRKTESTLNSGIMKNLGFDPTHGKMATVLKNSKGRSEKDSKVADLLGYKKDNVKLNPSKDILIKQKKRREKIWKEHFGAKDNDLDDSGSDLEIVT